MLLFTDLWDIKNNGVEWVWNSDNSHKKFSDNSSSGSNVEMEFPSSR
jgi:hypothetical protein